MRIKKVCPKCGGKLKLDESLSFGQIAFECEKCNYFFEAEDEFAAGQEIDDIIIEYNPHKSEMLNDFSDWLIQHDKLSASTAKQYSYKISRLMKTFHNDYQDNDMELVNDYYERLPTLNKREKTYKSVVAKYKQYLIDENIKNVEIEYEPRNEKIFMEYFVLSKEIKITAYYKNEEIISGYWTYDFFPITNLRQSINKYSALYDYFVFGKTIQKIRFLIDKENKKIKRYLELYEDAKNGDIQKQIEIGKIYCDVNEYTRALEWLDKSALQGCQESIDIIRKVANKDIIPFQIKLGEIYSKGILGETQKNKALYWYQKAAEQGNEDAIKWIESEAENNNVDAQIKIGDINYSKNKISESVYWYGKAYDQGSKKVIGKIEEIATSKKNVIAQLKLGEIYSKTEDKDNQKDKALYWYQKAAEQGNEDAIKWIESEAKNNNIDAQIKIGNIYYSREQKDEAFYWYWKAYEQGYPKAIDIIKEKADKENDVVFQLKLGELYFHRILGRNLIENKAFYWYRRAAEQGNKDAIKWFEEQAKKNDYEAIIQMGIIRYSEGDKSGAVYWFYKAIPIRYRPTIKIIEEIADKNNDVIFQFQLGEIYSKGIGGDKDNREAIRWYKRAAEQGNEEAIEWLINQNEAEINYFLGKLYYENKSLNKSIDESIYFFRQSAEKGYTKAQKFLGDLFYLGMEKKRDYQEAAMWYEKVANKIESNAEIQLRLGEIYDSGIDVEKNIAEALKWYEKAAGHKNVKAIEWLKQQSERNNVQATVALAKIFSDTVYYKRAAEQGDEIYIRWVESEAPYNRPLQEYLGELYFKNGELNFNKYNYSAAIDWYKKAIKKGYEKGTEKIVVIKEQIKEAAKKGDEDSLELLKAESKDDIECQMIIGDFYSKGPISRRDYDEAEKWYEKAAKQGSSSAVEKIKILAEQYNKSYYLCLGRIYSDKNCVFANKEEAFVWYDKAVQNGYSIDDVIPWVEEEALNNNIEALLFLGKLYNTDKYKIGYPDNSLNYYIKATNLGSEKAKKWIIDEAEKGDLKAQVVLGKFFSTDENKDDSKALYWYGKAAEQGDKNAIHWLENKADDDVEISLKVGQIYENKIGGDKDFDRAIRYYRIPAIKGNLEAKYRSACLMIKVGKETPEWLDMYIIETAEKGYVQSQYALGQKYYNNLKFKDAKFWFEKASEKGYAPAQFMLGFIYDFSKGVDRDFSQALKLYEMAANQGYAFAQLCLGNIYYYYDDIKNNHRIASEWYEKAAKQGLCQAMNNLGYLYENGYGVDRNIQHAVNYYDKAISVGNTNSWPNLLRATNAGNNIRIPIKVGLYYYEKREFTKAKEYWEKAALNNNPVALFCLCCIYIRGDGTFINRTHAKLLLDRVLEQINVDIIMDFLPSRIKEEINILKQYDISKLYDIKEVQVEKIDSLNKQMQIIKTNKGDFLDDLWSNGGHNWKQDIGRKVIATKSTRSGFFMLNYKQTIENISNNNELSSDKDDVLVNEKNKCFTNIYQQSKNVEIEIEERSKCFYPPFENLNISETKKPKKRVVLKKKRS